MNFSLERRRALFGALLALPLISGAAGYALTGEARQEYAATSTLWLKLNDPAERMVGVGLDSSEPQTNQSGYVAVQVEVLLSAPVLDAAASRIGLPPAQLDDAVTAEQIGDTSLVRLTARHEDAETAKELSAAVAASYRDRTRQDAQQAIERALVEIERRRDVLREQIRAVPNPGILPIEEQVERNALEAQYTQLANRAAELEVDQTLKQGATEVLGEPRVEQQEVGGAAARNLVTGLVLGAVLAIAGLVALQRRTTGAPAAAGLDAAASVPEPPMVLDGSEPIADEVYLELVDDEDDEDLADEPAGIPQETPSAVTALLIDLEAAEQDPAADAVDGADEDRPVVTSKVGRGAPPAPPRKARNDRNRRTLPRNSA